MENKITVHNLKTVQPFFELVKQRIKRYEIRKNDRDFKKGDYLILEEFTEVGKKHTGNRVLVRITDVQQLELKFALKQDFCVLSIKFKEEFDEKELEDLQEILKSIF